VSAHDIPLPLLPPCPNTIRVRVHEVRFFLGLTSNLDLIMCRRQPGIGKSFIITFGRVYRLTQAIHFLYSHIIFLPLAIGRLCEKCDGKW
jgi:hypothetical protein